MKKKKQDKRDLEILYSVCKDFAQALNSLSIDSYPRSLHSKYWLAASRAVMIEDFIEEVLSCVDQEEE